jgi:hypothetical protein
MNFSFNFWKMSRKARQSEIGDVTSNSSMNTPVQGVAPQWFRLGLDGRHHFIFHFSIYLS